MQDRKVARTDCPYCLKQFGVPDVEDVFELAGTVLGCPHCSIYLYVHPEGRVVVYNERKHGPIEK